jgi:hypothetical protein
MVEIAGTLSEIKSRGIDVFMAMQGTALNYLSPLVNP